MEINRNISKTQITWIVGVLLGLGLAIFMGSAAGSTDFVVVSTVLGAGLGIGTFLVLGKNYWMLIPFSLGAAFPVVPLGGRSLEFPELAIAGCSLFFLLRLASRKEKLNFFRPINIPILLFMAWVGMVFVLNPVGLAVMGSEVGGGRFYLKIALAFAAYLILSNREYSERDIRWVFGLIIFGACFSLIYGVISYLLIGPGINLNTGLVDEEYYTWHQLLSVPATTVSFIIFARWSPKQVFSIQKIWTALTYITCLLLVLISGKRMALITIFLAPLVSAILRRQISFIFITLGFATVTLGTLTAGHGQLFSLPLVAQRTISFLPGDWDPEMDQLRGGADEWRAELRQWAGTMIKRDPVIGGGFAVNIQETATAGAMAQEGGTIDIQVARYALGRSWHNRWLGYAADFGIPMSIIQVIIYAWVLFLSYRVFKLDSDRSVLSVFGAYLIIYNLSDLAASWTSGHTALDAFSRWWIYGIIVALFLQTAAKAREQPSGAGPSITSFRKQPSPRFARTGHL